MILKESGASSIALFSLLYLDDTVAGHKNPSSLGARPQVYKKKATIPQSELEPELLSGSLVSIVSPVLTRPEERNVQS